MNSALDDSWALFKGYRNRGGEIDYLLIGPTGLFAIEVKHVNGAFRITPEQWVYRRSDGYGNEVGDVTLLARADAPLSSSPESKERSVKASPTSAPTGQGEQA